MKKIKLILEGETGSGKTYQAFARTKKIKGKFIYIAPCRQLVYESYIKYASKKDKLSTGECCIAGTGNLFAVYESIHNVDISNYSTLIIDEAHFVTCRERGELLKELIQTFSDNIFLLTATRNFKKIEGFKIEKLKSIQKFEKKEITGEEFWHRVHAGVPSIIFRSRIRDCGTSGGEPLHSEICASERLRIQLAFARREIKLIECTNVLAQGLNFPAENILIESCGWNTDELIKQKIGRLGRPFLTDDTALLTYATYNKSGKIKKVNFKTLTYNNDKITNVDHLAEEIMHNLIYNDDFSFSEESEISDKKEKIKKLLKGKCHHQVFIFSEFGSVSKYTYRFSNNLIKIVGGLKEESQTDKKIKFYQNEEILLEKMIKEEVQKRCS